MDLVFFFFFLNYKLYLKEEEIKDTLGLVSGIEWVGRGKVGKRWFPFDLVSIGEREQAPLPVAWLLVCQERGVVM